MSRLKFLLNVHQYDSKPLPPMKNVRQQGIVDKIRQGNWNFVRARK